MSPDTSPDTNPTRPNNPVPPGEAVTQVHVRYVQLPDASGRMALLTLDNGLDHTKPTTLGPAGLRNLDLAMQRVLDTAGDEGLAALGVTGKPFVFCVGADLDAVKRGAGRDDALAFARSGHRAFRRLRDAPVPTFAFLNGSAMGGGLELALHCAYRTISATASPIAFPECMLGLVPGWGGTQLLPALVGADAAVRLVVDNPLDQNRVIHAREALELGMADVMYEAADFLEESLRWAARVLRGEVTVARRAVDRSEAWAASVARGRLHADVRTRGQAPAPYRALDLIDLARTASYEEGCRAEDEAVADLAVSDQLRAGLYAFDLVQRRARRPAGAPDRSLARRVTTVGIVGAGLMASQLALLCAQRLEVPVVMTDLDQARVDKGLAYVRGEIGALLEKDRLSPDRANRLRALVTGGTRAEALAGADFVLEAVFEEMKVKKQVFADVERVVSPDCVLATNTSSLSVSEMAADLSRPERVVGFHFFNPVAVLPLLEVVRGERTDDATLATAFATGRALGKSCVAVRDAPAFVFNRLLTRTMGEVLRAVDEGTPFEVADAAVGELGMPMPPFVLLQLVGPAVALHTGQTLHEAFPDRFHVSEGLRQLVAAGKAGVYVRDEYGRQQVDPEVAALWSRGDRAASPEQILDRARTALAEEIRLMLDGGVVAAPEDVDLCLLLGGGWGFWNGGITPYLDRSGVSDRVTGRLFHPGFHAPPEAQGR